MSFVLALLLAQAAANPLVRSDETGEPQVVGQASDGKFCSRFTGADKSGPWFCVNGDGTMQRGSQRTLAATGSPGSVSPGICRARDIKFTSGTQRYAATVTETFPASDFSVCMLVKTAAIPAGLPAGVFGSSGSPGAMTVIPCEIQSNGTCLSYISNGASFTTLGSASAFTVGSTRLFCFTYTRTGGAADNVIRQYWDGALDGNSPVSTAKLATTGVASGWSFSDYQAGGGVGAQVQFGGFFVTYKALTGARIALLTSNLCR